ncbi:MAG: TIR domain-containing protein [Acholeplasmatales bacterium]|jgi:hypothetical protein|nr:TIR domain-containing protein [Acholeplasmatales bacterium]
MNNIARHKVFISYYHADDQYYKNYLINLKEYDGYNRQSIFEDYSVHENEIDDTGLTSEQIRRIIRDDYIKEATVLILLCGCNTKKRKHIDWEIHAAMYNSEYNPKMGILVINLPSTNQYIRAGEDKEKPLISNGTNWVHLDTRQEYENAYPYMPSRIIDNFIKGVPITVVDWSTIENDSSKLKTLIHYAYERRKTNQYDHSAPLRRNNS